ncbi:MULTISPECIES: alkene reductase [unclassified Pseudomonas]|uniref:alkene reductase n=1 Tax=unclassified Pseudomonas TaxID=196821 RepID=UPI0008893D3B|nr:MULTISPECIES: alkene reductase [unclassified Pseudomonas]UVL58792.1 alkene reductase [Pseudomonas sp. B21-035]SDQ72029.1 N-ethylmaleimide reductase [Pseudomonas sp. UC 17F4]
MSTSASLFTPFELGPLQLPNRIVMAPMTRSRSSQPGDVPNAMMAAYYAQRASAGLIISEATQISPQGKGYSFTPGIYSAGQVAGWRQVTDAVHGQGGRIFLQLWHVGRMSHASFHADGQPVAPSALRADAQVWVVGDDGVGRMVEVSAPRALSQADIQAVIEDYRLAARHAREAGFDGVEIHAGNGYLIDQFLRTTSNLRNDAYGGSRENRIRFLLEVAAAVADEIGAQRTGVRLAPYITARGMDCTDVIPTILQAAKALGAQGIAYLHLAEADWDDAPQIPEPFRHELRQVFAGAIIVAGRYDEDRAQALLEAGLVDLIAFGRPFVANPDLPARLANGWPMAQFDGSRLFGGDELGYSDYPAFMTGK